MNKCIFETFMTEDNMNLTINEIIREGTELGLEKAKNYQIKNPEVFCNYINNVGDAIFDLVGNLDDGMEEGVRKALKSLEAHHINFKLGLIYPVNGVTDVIVTIVSDKFQDVTFSERFKMVYKLIDSELLKKYSFVFETLTYNEYKSSDA